MKKILALFLVLLMVVTSIATLASCTETQTPGTTTSPTDAVTTEPDTGSDEVTTSKDSNTESVDSTEGTTESTGTESGETTDTTDTTDTSETTDEDTTETVAPPVNPDALYGNGADIAEAGIDWETGFFANVKHTIDESKAQDISAEDLLAKMVNRDGDNALKAGEVWHVAGELALAEGTNYYGNGASIIVDGGILIKNAVDVVLKDIRIKGEITVKNSSEVIFYKVDIQSAKTAITLDKNSSDVSLTTCRIIGNDIAIKSAADNVTVYTCYAKARDGIMFDGDDIIVQDCKVFALPPHLMYLVFQDWNSRLVYRRKLGFLKQLIQTAQVVFS